MWDYPEVMEARKMVEAKIREACPFFSDDTVQKIVGSISERRMMCCVPEIKTNVVNYFKEAMTLFVIGDMDVEADWDEYIEELEALGMNEYLEIAQTAYTRTWGE